MKKITQHLPLLAIIILAFSLRLYKIDNPVADWHSFRQADTASVTREYIKHGVNLLIPRYHDLSNIQSGKENPEGFRLVEFPIINGLIAQTIRTFSLEKSEVLVSRLFSVFFSLITLISIYFLGLKLSNKTTAVVASLGFAVLPYSIYYSRVILPEPALLAFSSLSLLSFLIFLRKNNLFYYFVTLICFSISLLIKPYAIFLSPVFLSIFLIEPEKNLKKTIALFSLGLSLLPFLWWRNFINQFPAGIPASDWLYNKDNIRFKGAFFHWLFEVRLFTLIMGITGIIPFALGILKKGKSTFVYLVWLASLFAFSVIFAGGNIQHDYYQIIYLPIICLLIGRGVDFILSLPSSISNHLFGWISIIIITAFSLFISWYNIRGYFAVNHWEIVAAGKQADQLLPKDAKVIAPYNGDTAFLYQTNRTGWPIGYYIEDKIRMGAQYYISVNFDDETNSLMKKYQILEKNDQFVIIKLQ